MPGLYRIIRILTLGLTMAGCASQFNAAITKLDAAWKEQNDQILAQEGRRTFKVPRQQAFAAAQAAIRRLGMVIEQQDYHTGFLFVSAPSPTPLTGAEWAEVQAADTPNMRVILEEDVGGLSWFAKLDPSNRDVLANLFVADKGEGVEVAIGFRIRDKRAETDRATRMQAPPTAVRIGTRKFWATFEEELAAVMHKPVAADVKASALPPAGGTKEASVGSVPSAMAKGSNRDGVAILVGNRQYPGRLPAVEFAHKDANAMKRFILDSLGFREDNIVDLRDVTQLEMMAVFGSEQTHQGKLWRWVRPHVSDVVVFYAGHGAPGQQDGRAYLLPVNAEPEAAEANGYALDLLYANLIKLEARSVTVLLEASFAGDSPRGLLVQATTEASVVPQGHTAGELIVLAAAQGKQVASWDEEAQHGLFTRYLLQALNGAADEALYGNGDGRIALQEVKAYLDHEMTYAARRQYGREQTVAVVGDLRRVLVDLSSRLTRKQ